jgi:hypothetical protein
MLQKIAFCLRCLVFYLENQTYPGSQDRPPAMQRVIDFFREKGYEPDFPDR